MKTELDGKVVVITGASGGIGSAIARSFAAEGARLVLQYRTSRRNAERLQKELTGTEVLLVRADLCRDSDARRLLAAAVRRFGSVDTLIANAGSWEARDVPVHQMSLQQWRRTMDSVLTSVFLSTREFLKVVARQRSGNAVLIASTAAVFGEAGHADYAAAKSAMAYGFTRTLKNEIARIAPHTGSYCGGRINCVCPGWTVVPRTSGKLRDTAAVRRITATMALPQIARPEDIANAVVFLSSDRLARHITGQTLVVAGGMEGRWLWRPEEVDPTVA
ncbi:MAG TPA: SDR family oxidoreductase [Verrucomicrobiae bacterium]|nr:SDR family oxidoreductase [Verrucomicrobiae bacterium]